MPEWFIMAYVASQLMVAGPFTEVECQKVKRLLFHDVKAVCIEKGMLNGGRPT